MPLKTSSFKKEMFKQDFRNVGWISIVYFIGLMFTLPLQLAMALSDDVIEAANYGMYPKDTGLFSSTFLFEIQMILLFGLPVLMAVFLFRYLHVTSSSDFVHSLPIRRETLFNYRLMSGFVLLLVPILLIGFIMLLFIGFADVVDFYNIADLGNWLLLMIIVSWFVFMAGVFVGTLTGLSAVHGVLTFILLLFPMGIVALVFYHISFYVNGFSGSTVLDQSIPHLSPIADVADFSSIDAGEGFIPVSYSVLGIYVLITVLFYFISRFIYKKRQLESASHPIAVSWLRPVFKFGVTFCFALFAGMYFGETQNTYGWIIFGYFFGGIFGFFLSVMLLRKTWRVFSVPQWKGLAVYGAVAALLIALIPLVFITYENHVPASGEVKGVYLGTSYYQYDEYMTSEENQLIESEDTIETVKVLHEKLLQEGDPLKRDGERIFIAYELENGEETYRSYQADLARLQEELDAISKTKEYKEMNNPILNVDIDQVDRLSIHAPYKGSNIEIVEPDKIAGFLENVKKDIYQLPYQRVNGAAELGSFVEATINGEEPVHFSLELTYLNTQEWLIEEGLQEQVMLQADDVEYVEVYEWQHSRDLPPDLAIEQMKESGKVPLRIENADRINEMLEAPSNQSNGAYLVGFYLDEGRGYVNPVMGVHENDAPEFVIEALGNEK
ncbi:hypothetical protein GCM10010954_10250 [Halobacillus andaensis]|uniref:DUF6449 domain-containing protein n=1 Tax=Halobacillus andaensis TaxID=1176239 RepID=A0A917B2F2_HALAA|nr:DUF6449 domain-containing protein [Halobacillus andaensis]MBP2003817.1 ABC-2 type transport system permease protein [Halobacillus andaensis]GGF13472.1 hypothetical protein GCM10010954_10250 [Halobacillus andaensis]